ISSGLTGIAVARYASATASSGVPPKYGSIQIVVSALRYRKLGPPRAQRTGVAPTSARSISSRKVRGQNARSRIDETPAPAGAAKEVMTNSISPILQEVRPPPGTSPAP